MQSKSCEFVGVYGGRVISNADPLKLGRVKVRVPVLHGLGGDGGLIEDESLPWALPSGLPAGGSAMSGGVSWIPVPGDAVWIRFLDGELDKPIWEWGNQNLGQVEAFGALPVHAYDGAVAAKRAAFTRYDHWWELTPIGHDVWTKSGYHFEIIDEQTPGAPSGKFSWTTALGYLASLDDKAGAFTAYAPSVELVSEITSIYGTEGVEIMTPKIGLEFGAIELGGDFSSFKIDAVTRTEKGLRADFQQLGVSASALLVSCPSFSVTSGTLNYSADKNNPSTTADTGLTVARDRIGLGYKASDPVVRLSDLVRAMTEIKQLFDTHVHAHSGGIGNGGLPTKPAAFNPTASDRVFIEPATVVSKQV